MVLKPTLRHDKVLIWNGTNWTEQADLSSQPGGNNRKHQELQSAAIACGGNGPSNGT